MRRVSGFLGLVVAAALAACGSSGAGAPTDAAETPAATDVVEAEAVEAVEIADVAETVDAVEATDAAELPEAPSYALDDVLRVNQLQAKGTHNSYHIAPPDPIPEWNYTHAPLDVQLQQQGVRQVELDVHWTADGYHVYHVPYGDPNSTCDRFVDCLGIVKTWSDAHPGHHLLFILVEPKDDIDDEKITGTRWDQLDGEIRSVWPAGRLLTPDDVRGTHATLREALEADGWPTLGATRNRAMFAMLDSGAHRDDYLAGHPTLKDAPSSRATASANRTGRSWSTATRGPMRRPSWTACRRATWSARPWATRARRRTRPRRRRPRPWRTGRS